MSAEAKLKLSVGKVAKTERNFQYLLIRDKLLPQQGIGVVSLTPNGVEGQPVENPTFGTMELRDPEREGEGRSGFLFRRPAMLALGTVYWGVRSARQPDTSTAASRDFAMICADVNRF